MDKPKAVKLPPKHHNPPVTCFYWFTRGYCIKSDENCAYAHYNTGYYASDPTASYQQRHPYTTQPNVIPPTPPSGPPTMSFSDTSFDKHVRQAKEIEMYNRLRDIELRAREAKAKEKEAYLLQREAALDQREHDLAKFYSLLTGEMGRPASSASPSTAPSSMAPHPASTDEEPAALNDETSE